MGYKPKEPTAATAEANRAALTRYPMDDTADFDDIRRGLIARIDQTVTPEGEVVFDFATVQDMAPGQERPDSVNPSLWRQSQLNSLGGLFQVTEGLYQARGSGGANLTIVDAPEGLVIIDCTDSTDSARQGLDLFREHVADKPVAAVIYTHTHFDHYGGVKGVVDPADVAAGKVPIVAPGTIASFDRFALGENIITGSAMSRRAGYTFATMLAHGPCEMVSGGISIGGDRRINTTYISPTDPITETGMRRVLGGLEFEFLYAPDTEAPEEMHIWIPELKALTCAENANHTMHNIQTLRGARTRDARNFARYLDETIVRWGDEAEVHYGPHTWPVWGNDRVVGFLESQRDLYKYIHDQSLRLANQGLTPVEAAEIIELPDALGQKWHKRYYHGSLHHNVRAVFNKELGHWDGDPASVWPLPPVENAQRHVDLIGADKILAEGRKAFEAADYRWAVQVLHHLVFADPDNEEARNLQADAYEQLGYQQEIPQWRGIFLTAAMELRQGVHTEGAFSSVSPDIILNMPTDLLFDYAGVHLVADRAAGVDLRINITITGGKTDERWTIWVANSVLNARPAHADDVQLTITGPKPAIVGLLTQPAKAHSLMDSGALIADGDTTVLDTLTSLMDDFDPAFNLATP